jgi:hypothetical protein
MRHRHRHRSRLAPLVAAALAFASTFDGEDARADLCLPDRPLTPGCQLAPPGYPPQVPPQEEAAFRARVLADYYAANGPAAYRAQLAARYEQQRQAFIAATEAARPPDIPVRFPTFEAFSGFRLNVDLARKHLDYAQAGPQVGFALRIDKTFAVELPVSLMQSWGAFGRWATIGTAPSLLVGIQSPDTFVYLRGGPEALVPTGASGAAPNVLLGGNLGFGFLGYIAKLGNGGFVGLSFDIVVGCRGGIGGPSSSLDTPRCSVDSVAGIRLGY